MCFFFNPGILSLRSKLRKCTNHTQEFRVEVQKPKSAPVCQQILILISWITNHSNKCQWSFYPVLHSICVGTTSTSWYCSSKFYGFLLIGDSCQEKSSRNFVCRPNQGTPIVDHHIRNFEYLIPENQRPRNQETKKPRNQETFSSEGIPSTPQHTDSDPCTLAAAPRVSPGVTLLTLRLLPAYSSHCLLKNEQTN